MLESTTDRFQHRDAKIVCTMGPATNNESIIRDLMHAGMDVARLNFFSRHLSEHQKRMEMLRRGPRKKTGRSASCKTCRGRRSAPGG